VILYNDCALLGLMCAASELVYMERTRRATDHIRLNRYRLFCVESVVECQRQSLASSCEPSERRLTVIPFPRVRVRALVGAEDVCFGGFDTLWRVSYLALVPE
jgi:hypothetical protein